MEEKKKNVIAVTVASLAIGIMCLCVTGKMIPMSAAETDASLKGVTRHKGEVKGEGCIKLSDAQLALKAALGITQLSEEAFWAADLYNENNITLKNAQIILKAALGVASIEEMTLSEEDGNHSVPFCNNCNTFHAEGEHITEYCGTCNANHAEGEHATEYCGTCNANHAEGEHATEYCGTCNANHANGRHSSGSHHEDSSSHH